MQKPIPPNRSLDRRMCVQYLNLFLAFRAGLSKMKADFINSSPKSTYMYKVFY